MKTFYISITETRNKIVKTNAETESEAIQKARDAYRFYDIILDDGDTEKTTFNNETNEETINNYDGDIQII